MTEIAAACPAHPASPDPSHCSSFYFSWSASLLTCLIICSFVLFAVYCLSPPRTEVPRARRTAGTWSGLWSAERVLDKRWSNERMNYR